MPAVDQPKRERPTWRRWLIAGVAVVAGAWILYNAVMLVGVFITATELTAWSACVENLEAIGRSLEAYSKSWDGRLPPASTWCDALHPEYLESSRRFACPAARGPYSYAMNSRLSCAKLADIEDPSKVPLIFETTKTHRNAHDPLTSRRRDGLHKVPVGDHSVRGSEVLFADLRRRTVPDDEELTP